MLNSRLGPYEITAKLGEGGMGEVWRAIDTRLRREVAIKVLPAAFVADPERLARFEREAQLLAQLQHPNIASIYGIEETAGGGRASAGGEAIGAIALVMELVEGEDLSARIARGPIAVDEAIAIARQIAEALEAAHEKGIVHRDLKPQNVKVASDGTVKVLDFGLAKAMDAAVAGAAPSAAELARSPTLMNSPTVTSAAIGGGTQLGVILGTAAYMAPEQARGGPVDKRVDVWAFGVVLYEMLGGSALFAGATVSDTIANVLKTPVDFDALPGSVPPSLRRLLRRCLERIPKNRLRDIGEARIVLEEAVRGGDASEAMAVAPALRRPAGRELAAWAAALVATFTAVGLFTRTTSAPERSAPAAPQVTRFSVIADDGTLESYPALSPDGRTLVYALRPEEGPAALWAHSFESGTSRPLAGTEDGRQPFWSPDGRRLAFFAGGQLKRFDLATGLAQTLVAAPDARGGTWGDDGQIYYTPNSASGIFQITVASGTKRAATEPDSQRGEESHRYAWALPGGALVYTCTGNTEAGGVYWRGADDSTPRRILPDYSRAAYDARGYLLWVRDGALVAQRFDPKTGTLSGELTPLAPSVAGDQQATGEDWYTVSATGSLAFRAGSRFSSELRWFDRRGTALAAVASPAKYREPALSPDGRWIAVQVSDRDDQIWLFDADGTDQGRRLTFGAAQSETAAWSPDGRWVAYSSPRAGGWALLRKPADGSGEEELLHETGVGSWVDAWTPDGDSLVFERYVSGRGADLWLLPLGGDRQAVPLIETPANESHAAISPDGRLLAYASDESGRSELYVRALASAASRWQISRSGGDWPAWKADGSELYFAGLDRSLFMVPIASRDPFSFEAPRPLFRMQTPEPRISSNRTFFAPSADGQRFLINQLVDATGDVRIDVVSQWALPGGEP